MSDVTFGVKVPEELKRQLEELQKNFRTGKDFIQQLVNIYQVEKTKESIPTVAEDLKELQTLTQRINNIYLNLSYRIEGINKVQEEEKQELLKSKDFIITDLQTKIETLKAENNALDNTCSNQVNSINDLYEKVNQLTQNNDSIKALNEEYKSKIDTMAGIVEEYKNYKITNEELNKLLADSQTKNVELNNNVKEKDYVIEKLSGEVDAIKKDTENKIQQLNTKHDEVIRVVKEKLEIENDRAILELKLHNQKEQQEIQHKYNQEIQEYQNKYKELLKELREKKPSSSGVGNRKKQNTDNKTLP